ncbi:hypothetical protein C8A05DRAFT_35533 [Staphylotrichum tortipilum]|uniref:Uncharacterized protein n=1 Tax=Staphylotrichum tortipilum TaxID=2831512 RepID=A0AAN6MIM7_9PEZI|nr:hypothetical protein C8A05DRAFT_35533 [Staphylotrichum longicolle]
MNPNPLADRGKALEDQWVREKEKQLARDRAAAQKRQAAASDAPSGSGDKGQQQAGQGQK